MSKARKGKKKLVDADHYKNETLSPRVWPRGPILDWLVHFWFLNTRWFGLRARLRCPRCRSVGTFKPFGGMLRAGLAYNERRWLCKWCGLFHSPLYPDDTQCELGDNAWRRTTKKECDCDTPKNRVGNCNPWVG